MTAPALIRPATPEDAEALTWLHLDCWDEAYTALMPDDVLAARRGNVPERVDRWRLILASTSTTVVAETGTGLVGFASAGVGRSRPGLELMALYVRAARWGTGLGHALLDTAVGGSGCHLWVLEGNCRAITFYERHGFRTDGTTEDAPEGRHVLMVRRPEDTP